MSLHPRLAKADDYLAVRNLLWSCREEIPLHASFFEDLTLQWLAEKCRRRWVWKIKVARELAGVMVLRPEAGYSLRSAAFVELRYLAVGGDYRRRGIARALIRHAKARWWQLHALVNDNNDTIKTVLLREQFIQASKPLPGGWMKFKWYRATPAAPASETRKG